MRQSRRVMIALITVAAVALGVALVAGQLAPATTEVGEMYSSTPSAAALLPQPRDAYAQEAYEATALATFRAATYTQIANLRTPDLTVWTPPTFDADALATSAQVQRDMADVTLAGQGQTYTFVRGGRISVFLDGERNPVDSLRCQPRDVLAWASKGTYHGPGGYPVYLEAAHAGQCRLESGDFWAEIIVIEPTS